MNRLDLRQIFKVLGLIIELLYLVSFWEARFEISLEDMSSVVCQGPDKVIFSLRVILFCLPGGASVPAKHGPTYIYLE